MSIKIGATFVLILKKNMILQKSITISKKCDGNSVVGPYLH